ncbi:hypothetical protein WJX73_010633 [Symbiochloris irregularis]|uniref:NECAP PHear domain-containing protein n=1 Tax=Symbiochloris irregularis TaxID=706552 RepID=A0AAW1NJT4_9CHLO
MASVAVDQPDEERVELTVFTTKESYVYQIPPAGTTGHRAETWNVDSWLQAVAVHVVTCGEDCYIRLLDMKTGDLFAECPVPSNVPLITVVEPVIDSSRYFVLRVVDRQSRRHAFIGIGFRERMQASDFNATLHEHLRFLERMRQAAKQTAAYEAAAARRSSEGVSTASASTSGTEDANLPQTDFALKPGETIKLNMSKVQDRGGAVPGRSSKFASNVAALTGVEVPTLQPPGPGSSAQVPLLSPPPAKAAMRMPSGALFRDPPGETSQSDNTPTQGSYSAQEATTAPHDQRGASDPAQPPTSMLSRPVTEAKKGKAPISKLTAS